MAEFKFGEPKRVILKISFQFDGLVKRGSCFNHGRGNEIYPLQNKFFFFNDC